jgi:hypothetical protein
VADGSVLYLEPHDAATRRAPLALRTWNRAFTSSLRVLKFLENPV